MANDFSASAVVVVSAASGSGATRQHHLFPRYGNAHVRKTRAADIDAVGRIVAEEVIISPALFDTPQALIRAWDQRIAQVKRPVHINDKVFRSFKHSNPSPNLCIIRHDPLFFNLFPAFSLDYLRFYNYNRNIINLSRRFGYDRFS